ncbi:hypothetical protein F511_47310 [Dorcoceras hygrometricum]|uniref:Uncharacterized protein n=1 Tax=Dorcoceras hygrometricum TaxID=472368 RepID=A0A2Z6ZRD4_9LAMI|nr:hypothetical protein F511_47310 [Dorcoceras hygrometricum]
MCARQPCALAAHGGWKMALHDAKPLRMRWPRVSALPHARDARWPRNYGALAARLARGGWPLVARGCTLAGAVVRRCCAVADPSVAPLLVDDACRWSMMVRTGCASFTPLRRAVAHGVVRCRRVFYGGGAVASRRSGEAPAM